MTYRRCSLQFFLLSAVLLFPGCKARTDADGVADAFYAYQLENHSEFPVDLFTDEQAAVQARSALDSRNMMYGLPSDFKKIATNRQVSIESRMRRELITFVYEVNCANSRTRETLMVSREASKDPFRISAYVIEDIPWFREPGADGTSSA